jgi:pantoate--beta-alanine ligase
MSELRVFEDLPSLKQRLHAARMAGQRIGFVPTMGNLHAGHHALVHSARESCDYVLASIFVNPLQFGPNEDYSRYPRTLDEDIEALGKLGCDGLFIPAVQEMYPDGMGRHTLISVPVLSSLHCGASRPGHFDGVCTVVAKFFNMLRPDLAVFGLKDYQQFRIIGKMVEDLQIQVQLQGVATIREASGLALSSRNVFLNPDERSRAQAIYAALQDLATNLRQGKRNFAELQQEALDKLRFTGLTPDYVNICNRDTLHLAVPGDSDFVILAAAYSGKTRLIDNIIV